MRWFVEVSRVGDATPAERYCLEAKAWQAALQDARKLRGDTGPLSKFSIELLDQGYRAVDPIQKIRYLVNQAPADAPLQGGPLAQATPDVPPAPTATAKVAPAPAVEQVVPAVEQVVPAVEQVVPAVEQVVPAVEHVAAAAAVRRPRVAKRASEVPAAPNGWEASAAAAAGGSPADASTPAVQALVDAGIERTAPPRPVTSRPAPAAEGPIGAVKKTVVKARLELADTRERDAGAYLSPRPPGSAPSGAPSAVNGSSDVPEGSWATSSARAEVKSSSREPAAASNLRAGGAAVAGARPALLEFRELRTRLQHPTADAPITYCEAAFEVASGSSREQVELLLRDRLRAAQEELAQSPPGQLVQLAVFDHAFEQRPLRPPLGTLAWKDWRGEPVLGFPAFGEPTPPLSSSLPPRQAAGGDPPQALGSSAESRTMSAAPVPVPLFEAAGAIAVAAPSEPSLAPPPAPELVHEPAPAPVRALSDPSEAVPATTPVAPAVVPDAVPFAASATAAVLTDLPAQQPAPVELPDAEIPVELGELESSRSGAVPSSAAAAAEPLLAPPALVALSPDTPAAEVRASEPANVPVAPAVRPPSVPDVERASRPRIAIARRRAGEDLIGELFELMHELHFATDIGIGSDFLQSVLAEVLPCEVSFIQVFDINTRCFVVVRARGAGAERALMHRTPDKDPLTREIMRADGAKARSAQGDPRYLQGRWSHVTVPVTQVLSGPVRQGGRYLGSIELANPLGGTPFHQTEINAFDYICKQFADFVASRPVVLDEDVVLGR